MGWYNSLLKSLFKVMLVIAAIPVFIGIIVFLFWVGFGLDYGSQKDTSWIIALPVAFIFFVIFGIYLLLQRSKQRRYEALKDQARQEVINETRAEDQTQRY